MDISKVQKLNNLSMELRKHNIVNSKEDAIDYAENIFGHEYNFSSEKAVAPSDSEDIKKDVRKLTFALKEAVNQLADLKMQMEKLQKEFNDVRVNQPIRREPQPVVQLQTEPQQKVVEKPVEKPIDRNQVSPSEVSIEKFFYFGQK